jgi:hypothetical protein
MKPASYNQSIKTVVHASLHSSQRSNTQECLCVFKLEAAELENRLFPVESFSYCQTTVCAAFELAN